jgi:hypothetical protein
MTNLLQKSVGVFIPFPLYDDLVRKMDNARVKGWTTQPIPTLGSTTEAALLTIGTAVFPSSDAGIQLAALDTEIKRLKTAILQARNYCREDQWGSAVDTLDTVLEGMEA